MAEEFAVTTEKMSLGDRLHGYLSVAAAWEIIRLIEEHGVHPDAVIFPHGQALANEFTFDGTSSNTDGTDSFADVAMYVWEISSILDPNGDGYVLGCGFAEPAERDYPRKMPEDNFVTCYHE